MGSNAKVSTLNPKIPHQKLLLGDEGEFEKWHNFVCEEGTLERCNLSIVRSKSRNRYVRIGLRVKYDYPLLS